MDKKNYQQYLAGNSFLTNKIFTVVMLPPGYEPHR